MPARVSPMVAVRAEVDELFGSGRDIAGVLEEVMRLSARLVLLQVLEGGVASWLGRSWNSRAAGERVGQRDGFGDVRVKTTAGPIGLKRSRLRNTAEAFASQLLGKGVVRSEPLEALVVSAWVRGLSDRDIEALLAEALGPEAALSRSTASRVCARPRGEFEAFRQRDLTDIELDYLFLDGGHFEMHDGSRAEPVLAAYGITTVGQPVLLAVEPGASESHDAWAGLLEDLAQRGPRVPAAGRLRRRGGPDRRHRDQDGLRAAAAVFDPPSQKRPGQGPRRARRRAQGRLLGDLRAARGHPAGRDGRPRRTGQHRRLRPPLRAPAPRRRQMPAGRPPDPHRPPAVPR